MQTLWQDVRYGLRLLVKNPAFSLIAIVTLALGIGANTAIFSVVNSLLWQSLPYKDAERLVWIWETNAQNEVFEETASPPNYFDWKTANQSFEAMGALSRTAGIFTGQGEPERVTGAAVTDGFFAVLQAQPLLGRTFSVEEDKPGAEPVILISEGLWRRRFGADAAIIGKSVTLNGTPTTIIGVMGADFLNPRPGDRQAVEFWRPFRLNYSQINRRTDYLGVIARLKPSVTLAQAQAELQMIARNLEQQYPATNSGWSARVLSLHQRFFGDVSTALIFLMCAVGFLLLIACANVANLLLVKATVRRKEIALRAALGASRGRMLRQLMTESVILSLFGGGIGLLIAYWGVGAIIAVIPSNLPRLDAIHLDTRALFFTLAAALLTGLLFGLLPALQASRLNLNNVLKEGGRDSAAGASSNRLRNIFTVAEVALALILLVCAGLMVRSFINLQKVDPGFDASRVLTMQVQLSSTKYKEDAQLANFSEQLLERVTTLPGIEAAGLMSDMPLSGGGSYLSFAIEGQPFNPNAPTQDAMVHAASSDYFKTIGLPLKRGRLFAAQDHQTAPPVIVINETMARRYWGDEDPLGKRINFGDGNGQPTWLTIVGIVGDVHQEALHQDPYPETYAPIVQQPSWVFSVVVRTAADAATVAGSVREQVKQLDSDLPVFNVRAMETLLADAIARPRFNTLLITIFAALALLLAAVGIYGVMSYSVTQRQHEIGVRMALGAKATDILKMVIGQGLKLVLIGIGIGLAGVLVLTRWLESLLFGVTTTDLLTMVAVPLILAGVALAACFVPARRATRVDPMVALRYE